MRERYCGHRGAIVHSVGQTIDSAWCICERLTMNGLLGEITTPVHFHSKSPYDLNYYILQYSWMLAHRSSIDFF